MRTVWTEYVKVALKLRDINVGDIWRRYQNPCQIAYSVLQETHAISYLVITTVCLRISGNCVCYHQRFENISKTCWSNTQVCSSPTHVSCAEICALYGLQPQGTSSSSTKQYLHARQLWLLVPQLSLANQ